MNSEGCFAILWFLFGRRENRGIPNAIVTAEDSVVASTSASASSSAEDSAVASTSASASSSTQDSAAAGVYEVFLSFCGGDTRKGFTDFLYTYLVGASIRTFRDNDGLRVGERIGPELLKAIQESKISIPIFSKNYASSKWCLLELAQMVECHKNRGQMIYPIFYDVDPSDLRNQRGSYEEAFRQHMKKFDEDIVQSWREALRMVGELKGLELKKETDGREGELVKIVVEKVLLELKKNYTHVPKNLVGMDNRIEKLKGLLKVDSNGLRIVGIHGMGGLGKTTIAKVIYNQLCEYFEGHCFLDDVREKSRPRDGIVELQNQLVSKILKREVLKFSDADEGRNGIRDAVCGKKVLIVLDDVDENFQVDKLVGNQSWFGAQSRIIITTRDTEVLDAVEMARQSEDPLDVYARYEPDFMDDHHSLQLFSKYAFMRDSPNKGYEFLSKEVVSIATGLPLVLVVLGSAFFGVKDKDLWEEKLRKLREIPHNKVLEKLRFSFEALEYGQKQMFLDIACLFIGYDKTKPCYMWEDCGFYPGEGISVLVSKSLITVGDDDRLRMHDQLRDLGRHIVREEGWNEPGKRSRLWDDEAIHIFETRQGTSRVEALRLPYHFEDSDRRCFDANYFHGLPNLRYLIMWSSKHDLDGDFKQLFSNLRWLQWSWSGKFKPTNINLKNLVILNLSFSEFTEDWEGWSELKMAKKLKVLDLSDCSRIRVVPPLSTFTSLERLELASCSSLCRLDGLEQLKSLRYLDASHCKNLKTLPSLSNLTKLVELYLIYCEELIEIQGLEKLESLQVLDIGECLSLQTLPTFSNLKKLKTFKATGCEKLIKIEGLHILNSLELLDLKYCSSLKGVLDLSNLTKFVELDLHGCEKLTEIQGLEKLESLQVLDISGCWSLQTLPTFSNLKKLKTFKAKWCEMLIEFQGLDRLESLERLSISYCTSIDRLSDLPNFGMLKFIKLKSCNELHEVEGLGVIESLESLQITYCAKLREMPDLRSLKNLKKLRIRFLMELTVIRGLEELKSLELLDISGCKSIEALPDFSNLEKLIELNVSGCVKLTEICGLEELKSLELLDISGCKSIEALPDFSNLEKLIELNASWCVKLTEIRGLEKLKSLENLMIIGCEGLGNLPDLPNTMIERVDPFNDYPWSVPLAPSDSESEWSEDS